MSGRAKRLIVVTSRFPFGPQEAYLTSELDELVRYFDRVVVMPVRPPRQPARHRVPEGVEVLAWPLVNASLLRRAARTVVERPAATIGALGQLMASRDPGFAKNATVLVKALALAHWAREHRFDHIHAYWMSTPSTVAMVAALASDALWSATAHRWDIYERNAFDVKQRTVSFVRAISDRGERDLRARMPALNGRIRRVRLGTVVPDRATPLRPNDAEFRIVCPAAFVPVKGHKVLLAALAILRRSNVPIRCTLYGAGPMQSELEAEVDFLQLRNAVRFGGFIARDALHNAYRLGWFSAVVLASRSAGEKMMEGVPSALLEAMALGVPVVATDSGSVGELLDDRCGLLVKPDDPDALAAALLDVYINPDAARDRAGRAYDLVSARHDVRTQMRELASAFQRKDQE